MKFRKMQGLSNNFFLAALLLIALCLKMESSGAQEINALEDMEFISSSSTAKPHFHKRAYIYDNETSAFKKYNPVSLTLGGLMYLYQNVLSQQFSASCLYQPTCSDFSKQAIVEYGLFKGIFITSDRLNRCNEIAGLDIHPLSVNEKTKKAEDPIKLYK